MKKFNINKAFLTTVIHVIAVHSMDHSIRHITTEDNYYCHGLTIFHQIKKNTYKCDPKNENDIKNCEKGIKDLIRLKNTYYLIILLNYFNKKNILPSIDFNISSKAILFINNINNQKQKKITEKEKNKMLREKIEDIIIEPDSINYTLSGPE